MGRVILRSRKAVKVQRLWYLVPPKGLLYFITTATDSQLEQTSERWEILVFHNSRRILAVHQSRKWVVNSKAWYVKFHFIVAHLTKMTKPFLLRSIRSAFPRLGRHWKRCSDESISGPLGTFKRLSYQAMLNPVTPNDYWTKQWCW